MKEKVYEGRLEYDQDGAYVIHNHNTNTVFSLSSLLFKIYYAPINRIKIKIMNGCKTLFNEDGNLYLKRGVNGIYGYHVNGMDLESILFNNTDEYLEVTIAHGLSEGELYGLHSTGQKWLKQK